MNAYRFYMIMRGFRTESIYGGHLARKSPKYRDFIRGFILYLGSM
jgi:hypothetical protein